MNPSSSSPAQAVSEPASSSGGPPPATNTRARARIALAFGALGVVYGDIGTSPLYALRACFHVRGGGVPPTAENIYGILSLVVWSLVLVVSVKYISFVMRADNRGEGGILALLAIVAPQRRSKLPYRHLLVMLGLAGAALLYGDGMITPAITVLGAVEGLSGATPAVRPFILPLAVVILVGLFLLQPRGTEKVASLFSPVTLLWFLAIAGLGAREIVRNPAVLGAISPLHAIRFLQQNALQGFFTLGFVFLVVTGAEALYADMGHFGARPIRQAWFTLVFPALLVNYFGQGARLLADPSAAANPFSALVPRPLLYPMVALASAAAVVASQALISGAFSITQHAVQLGYLPRLTIVHTSPELRGQIYVPTVNWTLMLAAIGLVIGFRSSDALAAAYGIAVSGTMGITTILFYFVLRSRMRWPKRSAALLTGLFLVMDTSFLIANAVKFLEGGWFPLLVGAVAFSLMYTWVEGRTALLRSNTRRMLPLDLLIQDVERRRLPRVPGTAVFMTPDPGGGAPLVLLHHLKHNKALHERVLLLGMLTQEVPEVPPEQRVEVRERGAGFYDVTVRYGFMETPNAPAALASSAQLRGIFAPLQTTYYLGHHTLLATRKTPIAGWRKKLFVFLYRNALPATSHFGLPPNRIVEVGAQVQF